jgi:hypothetical protein
MAGDVISISSKAWYTGPTQAPPTGLSPLADQLLTLISNGVVASGGTHGGAIPVTDINSAVPDAIDAFLSDDQTYDNTKPKAFLNWMIVDEEFKKTTSSFHMGAVQVPSITGAMQKQQLTGPANMVVRRNGWLYVHVSNESNQDVYFDDIVINHKRGPFLEKGLASVKASAIYSAGIMDAYKQLSLSYEKQAIMLNPWRTIKLLLIQLIQYTKKTILKKPPNLP